MTREHDDPYDLPLGAGDRRPDRSGPAGGPFEWGGGEDETAAGAPEDDFASPPVTYTSEPPRRRRTWLWIGLGVLLLLVLLGLAAVTGYLLPRSGPSVVRADPALVDFGAVTVGETAAAREVTVENAGEQPLALGEAALGGPDAAAFEVSADGCSDTRLAPGRSCTVVVRFRPVEAGGARAALELPAEARNGPAAVTLLGEGVVSEPALELPPVAPGARTDGEGATDREADSIAEPPAEPSGPAPGPAPVPAPPPMPEPPPEPAPLPEPEPPPPPPPPPPPAELAAEPGSVDFGELALGAEGGPETVTLRNTGGSPAPIASLVLTGPDAGAFAVRDDGCTGRFLTPGGSCTATVVFRPRQEGVQRARLEARSPDLPDGGPTVALAGAGTTARLAVWPSTVAFGEVRLESTAEREIVLSNRGRAPLEIADVRIGGEAVREFAVVANGCAPTTPLGPGERCEVTVRFRPAREGVREAVLAVRHRGAGGDGEAALRGTGRPVPAPRAAVDPPAVRFGTVAGGGRSEIVTVTLTNRGTARMEVGAVRVEGADAGDFRVVAGSCDGASFLAPGSECTVGVRFAPGPAGAGERRARLVLPHGAPGGREVVELAGRAGA